MVDVYSDSIEDVSQLLAFCEDQKDMSRMSSALCTTISLNNIPMHSWSM